MNPSDHAVFKQLITVPGETKRGKYVVRVDFPAWVKEDGMKMKRWLNTVRTGGMLETINLRTFA